MQIRKLTKFTKAKNKKIYVNSVINTRKQNKYKHHEKKENTFTYETEIYKILMVNEIFMNLNLLQDLMNFLLRKRS